LSKIFKDDDIVVENYCFILDCIKKDEEAYSNLNSMPYDLALEKKEEILHQARLKSQQLIQNAVAYADDILSDANKKTQEKYEWAQKAGYEEGLRQGKASAEEKIIKLYNDMQLLINTIEGKKAEIISDYEDGLKELVLEVAKKVIDINLDKDDSIFLNIFNNALKEYKKLDWIKVTVSEYESEFAVTQSDKLLEMAKGATDIEIKVLEGAPRGTCVVETMQNIVDVSIGTQLQKLKTTLVNAGPTV